MSNETPPRPETAGPPRLRRTAARVLLVYFAICLSVMVSRQSAQIATSHTHNPYVFTAHYTAEGYRALDDPFKPRLFAYLLTAPFVELDQEPSRAGSAGRISAPAFERLVERWSFAWFFATQLLLIFGARRPLLYQLGTAAGVSFAYSLQDMVYPYDLPALFFATLAVVLVRNGRDRWLPLVLAVGVGFKETVAVFAVSRLAGNGPFKVRLQAVGEVLAVCFLVMMAIDLYSGRGFFAFEAHHQAETASDPTGPKLLQNLPTVLNPSTLVWAVNAGLALPLFLLPVRGDRLAGSFRWIGVFFAGGLLLFAGVGELRIWFELIPLCLHNTIGFLGRSPTPVGDEAPAPAG